MIEAGIPPSAQAPQNANFVKNVARLIGLIALIEGAIMGVFALLENVFEFRLNWYSELVIDAGLLALILSLLVIKRSQGGWEAHKKLKQAFNDLKDRSEGVISTQARMIEASAKLAALGEMAGGIAHEISTPVASLQLTAEQLQELLEEESPDKALMHKMLVSMKAMTFRIGRILQGLRILSKDDSKLPFESCSLEQVVANSVSLVNDLCPERFLKGSVKLEVRIQDGNTQLDCHPIQLGQVLVNLLNNAYDAVRSLPEPWVRVVAQASSKWVDISVTDSGAGIPAEIREKLFSPLFSTKGPIHGTGLGLSISRRIVTLHHGTLEYDERSPNTSFVIRLPLKQQKAAPLAATPSQFDDWIQAHRNWRIRVRDSITGISKEVLNPGEIEKDDLCLLGKWLHENAQKYASHDDFRLLIKKHAEFHARVAGILRDSGGQSTQERLEHIGASSMFALLSEELIVLIQNLKGISAGMDHKK